MRLRVVGRFATTVMVNGDTIRFACQPGDVIEVDETAGQALLRDVGPLLEAAHLEVLEAPAVEMVEVPAEIVAPPKRAYTRQIVKRPGPKPSARKKP